MKSPSPFAAFDRQLRADFEAETSHKLEILGIEPEKPKRRAGREKSKVKLEPLVPMNVPGELAGQMGILGDALGISRTAFMRLVLAAGTQAVLEELEENEGRVTLPLCLRVGKEPKGFYYQQIRIVSPERFEALRMERPAPLQKWKAWHPNDRTGSPMKPPTRVPAVPRPGDAR